MALRVRTPEQKAARRVAYAANKQGGEYAAIRRWRSANPDKLRVIARRAYEKSKDKVHAYHRAFYLKQRETIAGRPKPDTCECCGEKSKIVWDHCHNSEKFRGWICDRCNRVLGFVRDDVETLQKLADYLRRA